MAPAKLVSTTARRNILKALLVLPVLALIRQRLLAQAPSDQARPDDIVEVDGWILKRSDIA